MRQFKGVIIGCFRDGEQVFNKIGSVAYLPFAHSLVLCFCQRYYGRLAAPGHPLGVRRPGRIHHSAEPVLGVLQLPCSHCPSPNLASLADYTTTWAGDVTRSQLRRFRYSTPGGAATETGQSLVAETRRAGGFQTRRLCTTTLEGIDRQTRENRVSFSFDILSSLRGLPGQMDDGTVDAETLTAWISEARRLCAERDRKDLGDQQIGKVLATAPVGTDGAWPCEPVRDLLDSMPLPEHVGKGFVVGKANLRGVTSMSLYEGGAQERELAKKYHQYADECAARWPFTAKLLRQLAQQYEAYAQWEDIDAEWTDETWA